MLVAGSGEKAPNNAITLQRFLKGVSLKLGAIRAPLNSSNNKVHFMFVFVGGSNTNPKSARTGSGFRRGDDTVGDPHRTPISQFELFELKFVTSSFSSLSSC